MQLFNKLTATFSRYLILIGDQQIIDERIKELHAYEKEILLKQALLGDADAQDLQILNRPEQAKLLRSLVLQKVANNENAEDAIAALQLIENTPTHPIKCDHVYSIPVLSEIGDILRMATFAGLIIGGALLVTLGVNPRFCGEQNSSQFCSQVRAVQRYFVEPKGE